METEGPVQLCKNVHTEQILDQCTTALKNIQG